MCVPMYVCMYVCVFKNILIDFYSILLALIKLVDTAILITIKQ